MFFDCKSVRKMANSGFCITSVVILRDGDHARTVDSGQWTVNSEQGTGAGGLRDGKAGRRERGGENREQG